MDGSGGSQGLTEAHSDPSQCQFEFPNGERCPRIFGHEAYSEHWHPRDSGWKTNPNIDGNQHWAQQEFAKHLTEEEEKR